MKVAQVLIQELDIGAVAITDRDKLLAFTGIGDDHHLPGKPISSSYTQRAIETGEVVYADGNEGCLTAARFIRTVSWGSTLVIPLRGENQRVIGTIKLYEAKNRLFSSINRTLGEGIAQLLSAQILAGQYERQKALLTQSEIKLLHAQVNPHFLFNALNTLKAVIRRDSDQAGQLVQYLSTFFRKNLETADGNCHSCRWRSSMLTPICRLRRLAFRLTCRSRWRCRKGWRITSCRLLPCSRSWRTPLSMVHRNILASAKLPSAPARTIAGCSWISKITPGCTGPTPRPAGWG
ncbi:histidine kinase [Klebsiella pneumoniae subsp. pneumoniae]|nr:histidine kinase [Klebsiella pneumoniae subsp. pneumoniae]